MRWRRGRGAQKSRKMKSGWWWKSYRRSLTICMKKRSRCRNKRR